MSQDNFNSLITNHAAYITREMDDYFQINTNKVNDTISHIMTPNFSKLKKKKKLKILVTTFWAYPHIGGLSNYLTTLKEGLESLGHEIDIISPNFFNEKKCKKLRSNTRKELEIFFQDRYGTSSKKIIKNMSSLYVYEQMLGEINLDKYDLFHAQDIFTANIIGRLNLRYNKPIFFTPHGLYTDSRIKFGKIKSGSIEEVYFRCVEKRAINNAVKTIIISNSFRETLSQYGTDNKDIITIHTGVNMKEIRKSNDKKSKLVITTIARLSPRKGHIHLLEALALIKSSLDNVEVRIIGDGEMREELEHLVNILGLSMVYFYGSRNDIPELLSESDIFVLPTLNDNLPISIIEAMFGQQAIITSRCGGIEEIIHHLKTGLLIQPGASLKLASHLLLLIQEPDLRKFLAKNAQEYALANLTAESMVKKILNIYQMGEGIDGS